MSSRITTCPHCSTRLSVSEGITDKTLICPHCLADVDNPLPGVQIQAPNINTDVKRDMSVGSSVLAVLMGLCVLGIVIAFLLGLKSRKMGGEKGLGVSVVSIFTMTTCFGVLDVLVSIAIIRRLVRWGISGAQTPSSPLRVYGIVLLSLGTIVAVVIFFGFACGGWVFVQMK